ncbi:MAG: aspartate aminotransferase family protein [Acidimicrobiales bacterium]
MPVPSFLHPFAAPTRTDYVRIVRGEGAAVFDADGRRYIDALASLWFCAIGHGRSEVADAMAQQAGTLAAFHSFDRFTNQPADELCDQLVGLAPMDGARVFLTSSGSEAVDTAIKLARLTHHLRGEPERTVVISRQRAYHGVTYGGVSSQGLDANRVGWGPLLPDVVQVPHDDLDALDRALADHEGRVAAVLAEPVIGAGGVIPPVPGYLEGLRAACDRTGALLILDEVICGFGRLGRWFGVEALAPSVVPDLVTFAKGATSGYMPLGGVLVGPAVRGPLEADPAYVLRHGHTYSGHPVACAAALANLQILRGEGLLERAEHIGQRLRTGLAPLVTEGHLAGVRGEGALLAAVLHPDQKATELRDELQASGVIVRPIFEECIALCPPLVIDDDDLDRISEAVTSAVTSLPRHA